MIKAANIFVEHTPAKPTASASNSAKFSEEAPRFAENKHNDSANENKDLYSSAKVDRAENTKSNPRKESRKAQTGDSPESKEAKKSDARNNEKADFQQVIAQVMSGPSDAGSVETTQSVEYLSESMVTAEAEVISPVLSQTVSAKGVPADVPAGLMAIPTPVATETQAPLPDAGIAAESALELPKPEITIQQAGNTLPVENAENQEQVFQPERIQNPQQHTSGRPESSSITAKVPLSDIPRTSVEASDSSTDAKTAATEINPNSVDSGTMTPGRPVVPFSSTESPKADQSVTDTVTTKLSDAAAVGKTQTDARSSSGDSSDSTSSEQSTDNGKTSAFVPPMSTQTPQDASNYTSAENQPAGTTSSQSDSEKVATVADASTVQGRSSQVESMTEWFDTTPTTTTPTNDVADVSATSGVKMAEQITTHVQMRRDELGQEMVIRLDPPELGKVRIQIRSENGELAGVIRADNPQTLAELQKESVSLMQRLNDAGVQIKTLDLQMNDMSQQGRGDQSFAQAQNAYSMFQQSNGQGRGYGYDHAGQDDSTILSQEDPEGWNSQTGQYVSDSALNVML